MSIEQLIKKKEECMILGFFKGRCVLFSWLASPSSFLSLFLFDRWHDQKIDVFSQV